MMFIALSPRGIYSVNVLDFHFQIVIHTPKWINTAPSGLDPIHTMLP